MTRIAAPRAVKPAKVAKASEAAAPPPAAAPLPAELLLAKPMRYRGKPYPANEVIHPAELGMDAETVGWLVATGTVEDPDGDEK